MLDKIQINNTISISSIIIIYEILILLLYFVKVLEISKMKMLISWPLCINIFIILIIKI